jgi:transcriptional regulator with XRE-family HTH domain
VTNRNTSSSPSHPQDIPLWRLGATLRQYRSQRGLSQQALATSTGIRRAYLSDIERGKRNITVLTLLHLMQGLRIPSAWLFTALDTPTALLPRIADDPLASPQAREAVVTHEGTAPLVPDNAAILLRLLGSTIRHYRQQQGLSQPDLAARTGLNPTYIGQIEHGQRNLSVLNLVRIAEALRLSAAYLLTPLETYQHSSLSSES